MLRKGDMKEAPYWASTDIRRHSTKFSRRGDPAPEICAPLHLRIYHLKLYHI